MQISKVKITTLSENKGQIEGVPANPRLIKDERYKKLLKSIQEDPELMEMKPLFVYENVVIAGNMRLKACQELGWKEIPVIKINKDCPAEILRSRAIKDNHTYGENDWDALANEWSTDPLGDWGIFKDYVIFNPELNPGSFTGVVTDEDIEKMQGKLDNQFNYSMVNSFDIICPKCGHEFQVKSPK